MELDFNTTKTLKNVTVGVQQDWSSLTEAYSPNFFAMFLAAVFAGLIVALLGHKKIPKLAFPLYFALGRKRSTIPSVSLLMVIKSIYVFGTDFPKIIEMAAQNYGENFRLNFLGLFNMVFLTNPLMVQKLLMSSKPEHLNKPQQYKLFRIGESKDGLLSLPPDIWKSHRSAVSKAFTNTGLIRQLNIFEEHARRFILTLKEEYMLNPCFSKLEMPIEEQLGQFTFETISHVAAGKQLYDLSNEENNQFHTKFERMKQLMSYRIMNFVYWPDFIWNLNPKKQELNRIQDDIVCYWNKVIAVIRKQFDEDAKYGGASDDDMAGKSLVELMINAKLSDKEINVELSTFLYGGHETTSSTAKLLLFLIATHKEYQDKCREEIDKMFDQICASKSNELSMEALNSLTFVDMCIKESMRLYTLVPFFGRELESPLQLDENTLLPSGTTVFTATWIQHRNPLLYPEPEKFDPERFSTENVKKRGLGEYIPFSLGPRNCVGYKSAMIQLKVLVAYVLHHFEVHSDMTIVKLDRLMSKQMWPHPELGIKVSLR